MKEVSSQGDEVSDKSGEVVEMPRNLAARIRRDGDQFRAEIEINGTLLLAHADTPGEALADIGVELDRWLVEKAW